MIRETDKSRFLGCAVRPLLRSGKGEDARLRSE